MPSLNNVRPIFSVLCLCREGLYALPNTMFDLFFKAVVTFFVEGHKALPCTGTVQPIF